MTEKKFRLASAFTLFCVEVQMLHHHQSYRSLNSWLLPFVQVSMSSSTRCDAVSVSSQLDTCIAEVLAGVSQC